MSYLFLQWHDPTDFLFGLLAELRDERDGEHVHSRSYPYQSRYALLQHDAISINRLPVRNERDVLRCRDVGAFDLLVTLLPRVC
jgi:hypothetical protein